MSLAAELAFRGYFDLHAGEGGTYGAYFTAVGLLLLTAMTGEVSVMP